MTERRTWVEQVMGLPVSLLARGPGAADADGGAVYSYLREVDATYSLWRTDSVLARLGPDAPELREVRDRCAHWQEVTEGLFDPVRLDGVWDPSGLVKGWAAERAFALLPDGPDWCLNAGGDVLVRGTEPFGIGVADPQDPQGVSAVVRLTRGAVATSGTAARGAHLYDPRTRASVAGDWLSISVTGPSLESADVLATAAFVAGDAWPDLLARFPSYVGMGIDRGGVAHPMSGWPV